MKDEKFNPWKDVFGYYDADFDGDVDWVDADIIDQEYAEIDKIINGPTYLDIDDSDDEEDEDDEDDFKDILEEEFEEDFDDEDDEDDEDDFDEEDDF